MVVVVIEMIEIRSKRNEIISCVPRVEIHGEDCGRIELDECVFVVDEIVGDVSVRESCGSLDGGSFVGAVGSGSSSSFEISFDHGGFVAAS